jgi:hypothetical protein
MQEVLDGVSWHAGHAIVWSCQLSLCSLHRTRTRWNALNFDPSQQLAQEAPQHGGSTRLRMQGSGGRTQSTLSRALHVAANDKASRKWRPATHTPVQRVAAQPQDHCVPEGPLLAPLPHSVGHDRGNQVLDSVRLARLQDQRGLGMS